jgi:hypothetical protein
MDVLLIPLDAPPPITVVRPGPTSEGRAPSVAPRELGAAVGCLVALGVVLAATAWSGPAGVLGDGTSDVGLAVACLVAATTGGAVIGPRAARATGTWAWIGVTVLLALTVMVVGDAAVAAGLALVSSTGTFDSGIFERLAGVAMVGVIGLFVVGPFATVGLLVPAAVWSLVMRFATRR